MFLRLVPMSSFTPAVKPETKAASMVNHKRGAFSARLKSILVSSQRITDLIEEYYINKKHKSLFALELSLMYNACALYCKPTATIGYLSILQ